MEEPEGSQQVTRKNWKSGMARRGFKCERQVDTKSLGTELHGIPHIARRGLNFWFKVLKGYNKACVIEFYQNMVSIVDVPVNELRIESMLDNVRVVLTPNIIAKYLRYTRPPLSTVKYPLPGGTYIDPSIVNNALYPDIRLYDGHHKQGLFREEYRLLNKAIHMNLFPRGSEHHPRQRGAELLFVLASGDGRVCPAAAEYVAPSEVESEDSDEDEEDEELDLGMFRGECTEFFVDTGTSGGQGD
ncbi:hypothetical protein RHMOL_Rhmol01G0078900 [Rhododendron molle]|uniref:Uncharacterized protein n=1 Tax=Rhododendron molle TaxID=49168 RepID=A0ACC0Q0J9_RHOML|nr:hypothetical protein RHMOL_Rhmol01G0078900 [Rhododendron molle]